MELCVECRKGYCPNRVKRVFGKLRPGFCSPQCYTKDTMRRSDLAEIKAKKLASDVIDTLHEWGYISDHDAADPDRFARAVDKLVPLLTDKGSA